MVKLAMSVRLNNKSLAIKEIKDNKIDIIIFVNNIFGYLFNLIK